ncbi:MULTISPECIES: hypothetical protein [Sphingobacterium]|uniref:hypothetical protein n=1 Tax=Sphingobacterium TaxID=28453 RepID=UPI000B93D413|nr:hypothetical protein CHT99_18215 [Sphingobacterium cellulitidis]
MRKINSVKHADLIHIIREFEEILSEESRFAERDALREQKDGLSALHQEYLQALIKLEKIIEDYHYESRKIRHLYVSKLFRKLGLKKKQPVKHKIMVKQVNVLAS